MLRATRGSMVGLQLGFAEVRTSDNWWRTPVAEEKATRQCSERRSSSGEGMNGLWELEWTLKMQYHTAQPRISAAMKDSPLRNVRGLLRGVVNNTRPKEQSGAFGMKLTARRGESNECFACWHRGLVRRNWFWLVRLGRGKVEVEHRLDMLLVGRALFRWSEDSCKLAAG